MATDNFSFSYEGRPAWRNQWLLLTLITLWGLITILITVGVAFDKASPDDLTMLAISWGVFVLLVLVAMYNKYSWRYILRDDQVQSLHGIVARDMKSIRLQDIRNVNVKQSFFQRIFNIGDVQFSSAGGSGIEVAFFGVLDPMALQEKVQSDRRGAPAE